MQCFYLCAGGSTGRSRLEIIGFALYMTLQPRKVGTPGRQALLLQIMLCCHLSQSSAWAAMAKNNSLRNCFFPTTFCCSQAQAVRVDWLHLLQMFCKRHFVEFTLGILQCFLLPELHV